MNGVGAVFSLLTSGCLELYFIGGVATDAKPAPEGDAGAEEAKKRQRPFMASSGQISQLLSKLRADLNLRSENGKLNSYLLQALLDKGEELSKFSAEFMDCLQRHVPANPHAFLAWDDTPPDDPETWELPTVSEQISSLARRFGRIDLSHCQSLAGEIQSRVGTGKQERGPGYSVVLAPKMSFLCEFFHMRGVRDPYNLKAFPRAGVGSAAGGVAVGECARLCQHILR